MTADSRCECSAENECLPVWHAALAEEQANPEMYRWHNPLVCVFVLQHRSMFRRDHGDVQFQNLQLFIDQGIDAVNRVAKQTKTRNKGSNPQLTPPELSAYDSLPQGFPERFAVSFQALPATDGSFVSHGLEEYGRRLADLANATIAAWNQLRLSVAHPERREHPRPLCSLLRCGHVT